MLISLKDRLNHAAYILYILTILSVCDQDDQGVTNGRDGMTHSKQCGLFKQTIGLRFAN